MIGRFLVLILSTIAILPHLNGMIVPSKYCMLKNGQLKQYKYDDVERDDSNACGICWERISEESFPHHSITWPNPYGKYVHTYCFNRIKDAQQSVLDETDLLHSWNKDEAHYAATSAVITEITKTGIANIKYLLYCRGGAGELKRLFDNEGLNAMLNKTRNKPRNHE